MQTIFIISHFYSYQVVLSVVKKTARTTNAAFLCDHYTPILSGPTMLHLVMVSFPSHLIFSLPFSSCYSFLSTAIAPFLTALFRFPC